MAFTTKENEELEVAPPRPLTIPEPEREPEQPLPVEAPDHEPVPVPA